MYAYHSVKSQSCDKTQVLLLANDSLCSTHISTSFSAPTLLVGRGRQEGDEHVSRGSATPTTLRWAGLPGPQFLGTLTKETVEILYFVW